MYPHIVLMTRVYKLTFYVGRYTTLQRTHVIVNVTSEVIFYSNFRRTNVRQLHYNISYTIMCAVYLRGRTQWYNDKHFIRRTMRIK